MTRILQPVVRALRDRGAPYQGVLYAGLMSTKTGPKLIEFNCRFGDPECQVLVPRLKSDLLPALIAARDGVLDSIDLRWRSETALCVVLASNGYPGAYATGSEIRGLERARKIEGVEIFHAGTVERDGKIIAAGGRVLNVSALGEERRGGAGPRIQGNRLHRLAGGILPAGYWLAGNCPQIVDLIVRCFSRSRSCSFSQGSCSSGPTAGRRIGAVSTSTIHLLNWRFA